MFEIAQACARSAMTCCLPAVGADDSATSVVTPTSEGYGRGDCSQNCFSLLKLKKIENINYLSLHIK